MNHQLIPRVESGAHWGSSARFLGSCIIIMLKSLFLSREMCLWRMWWVCEGCGEAFGAPWWANVECHMGLKSCLYFISFFAGRPRWPVNPEGNATHPDLPVRYNHLKCRKSSAHALFATRWPATKTPSSRWHDSSFLGKHCGWHPAQCWRKTDIPRIISRSSKWNQPPPQCRWTINSLYPAFGM